ncbi:MAG: type I DNA topoisomerase [Chloroflexi bacterium]|nr:type I DNA topoisomerase [Chloroflexota bacterium]
MSRNLVIVESPAKAKTIERYLGDDHTVLASKGHVRDLPENPGKGKLGVDVEHDFAPDYVISKDREREVAAIRKAAGRAETVFLATDLDREGEAIAWHVTKAADIPTSKQQRVTFSEITEPAIREAFANPRQIDMHLVDAQQARRVVDRMVGYTLSPLLARKVRSGLSAGRVQSVAVRLVVEREREIEAFITREYWTLQAQLRTQTGAVFPAALVRIDGAATGGADDPQVIGDEAAALGHVQALAAERPLVRAITVRQQKRSPAAPFTTSTLQQEASRKLGFSPKRTMSIAQRLYEGVEVDGEQVGLTTYMRTDSTAMAGVAMGEAREVIAQRYGPDYTMPKGRVYKTKAKGAQEAHEAIRPTSFQRDPDSIARWLQPEELRLYRLIWQRALASQMTEKRMETTAIELDAGRYGLRASATRTLFDGFSRVYTEGRDDDLEEDEAEAALPPLAEGDVTDVDEVTPTQHFTAPPGRYSEATLVRALEEHGIGRPSTYAATIATIIERGYVTVKEKRLLPEPVARIVTDLLVDHFGEFVDPEFTARMEERLDQVASGELDWVPLLRDFYWPFKDLVDLKRKELRRAEFTTEPSDEVCSEGHPMVIRLGRNGRFLACSLYPEHKESRPLPGEEEERVPMAGEGETCPTCGQGTLVQKRGRFGAFVGCDRYPECTYIHKDGPPPPDQLPFEVACPTCKEGHLVARRARRTGNVFWGCSRYPKCRFTSSREPVGAVHDADGGPVARSTDGSGICLACGAPIELPESVTVGEVLSGGPADPTALKPAARARATGGKRTSTAGAARRTSKARAAKPAA